MQTEPKHAIEIQTVTNRRELKQFIRFPLDLYKGCTKIKGPLGFSDMDSEGLLVNKIPAKMIKFATL